MMYYIYILYIYPHVDKNGSMMCRELVENALKNLPVLLKCKYVCLYECLFVEYLHISINITYRYQ